MSPTLHRLLVGHEVSRFRRRLDALFAVALALGTFAAYALGALRVSGGAILLPRGATIVGLLAAAGFGARRAGLLAAWAVLFASYLGFRAHHALFGASGHSPAAVFLDPIGLSVLAAGAVVYGSLGFAVGAVGRAVAHRIPLGLHS